ncbi:MAG: alpha/beta hydrolase-fold protein [Arenicellales bacterium]
MAGALLDFITRDTGTDPQYAVIWLHGLGADGHDFEPVVPELGLSIPTALRFIFPHAPTRPVTINGGMVMRAWYDIVAMDLGSGVDTVGINESSEQLRGLIQATVDSGIRTDHVVLAGFSQGGVIALHTALLYPRKLAGVVALSTFVATPAAIQDSASEANERVPIFMAHGRFDPVIPYSLGKRSMDFLVNEGYPVQWHEYPMEHSVHPDEIRDLADWLGGLVDK